MNEEKLREILGIAVGGASMCWQNVEAAGVFDSNRAVHLVELTVRAIRVLEEEDRPKARWNQEAISQWASDTFGPVRSNFTIAARANEEMAELLTCLAKDDNDPHAREEVADVIITLCRMVSRLGGNMAQDVRAKMEVNVRRKWKSRGDGMGDHVKAEIEEKSDGSRQLEINVGDVRKIPKFIDELREAYSADKAVDRRDRKG